MAAAQQVSLAIEEGGADGNAAFGEAQASFLDGDFQHLFVESADAFPVIRHSISSMTVWRQRRPKVGPNKCSFPLINNMLVRLQGERPKVATGDLASEVGKQQRVRLTTHVSR